MLIRVLEIPIGSPDFRFDGGETQPFVEVDWFRDDDPMFPQLSPETMTLFEEEVRGKRYYNSSKAYLVLCPRFSFTINYDPDAMVSQRNSQPEGGQR